MMARPIVGPRVGGLPHIVADRKTGFIVKPEDSTALGEAIVFLLENPERAIEMGNAARRRVQKLFSWEQCVTAYESLWRQLIMDWREQSLILSQ